MILTKYKIKDNSVIGGDKVSTPYFGELIFERIHITDDKEIADYFRKKCRYTVTEIPDEEA